MAEALRERPQACAMSPLPPLETCFCLPFFGPRGLCSVLFQGSLSPMGLGSSNTLPPLVPQAEGGSGLLVWGLHIPSGPLTPLTHLYARLFTFRIPWGSCYYPA